MSTTTEGSSSQPAPTQPRRAAAAAFLGSVVEYYDLVAYGTASALVFGESFFRGVPSQVALLLSFATFASGYLMRPLGGLVFGWIGDRRGRRAAIMGTISLMGVSTVLIGLLPTYGTIGALAPILLVVLRVCQGLAVGGELGGAVLIAVEHAPRRRRGFFGSFATAGSQGGTVLASIVFALLTSQLSPEAFMAWGWRVPFLLSAVIVLIGLLIRYRLDETPDFVAVSRADKQRNPIRSALLDHPRAVVCITLVMAGMMSIWYLLTVYSLSYATENVGIDRSTMLWVITGATALVVVLNPFWGALSDRIGRGGLVAGGLVAEAALLFVYFAALTSENILAIFFTLLAVAGIGHACVNGVFPAFIAESLPARVRYTAGSVGMQLAGVVAGFAPLVAVAIAGGPLGIWLIALVALVFCVAGAMAARWITRAAAAQDRADVDRSPAPPAGVSA